jgi:glycosyltransferase involved in cell wall biosynthesis
MRIVFLNRRIPRASDGGRRSRAAMIHLARRHDVSLIPVLYGDDFIGHSDVAEFGVRVEEPVRLARRPEVSRFTPGLPRPEPPELPGLRARLREADWVYLIEPWLAPYLTARAFGHRRPVLHWDHDSLRLWHRSAAGAMAEAGLPLRQLRFTVSALSYEWYERRYLPAFDLVSVPSERERQDLSARLAGPVVRVRNFVSLDELAPARAVPAGDAPPTVVFVGSDFPPNVDAARWLLTEVWPAVVARVPGARLHLAGRGLAARLPPLPASVTSGGFDDLATLLAGARAVACPIRFGGGIPYKVIDAAAAARPTLITDYCARAVAPAGGGMRLTTPREWAGAMIRVLQDPGEADRLGRLAFEGIGQAYAEPEWEADMARLEETALSVASR